MTPQELEDFARVLEKLILERHERALERFGTLEALYQEEQSRTNNLSGRVRLLTTANKKLTTQLAKAKQKVLRLDDTLGCLIEIVEAARQISPDVSDRIDNIIDDVNPLLRDKI